MSEPQPPALLPPATVEDELSSLLPGLGRPRYAPTAGARSLRSVSSRGSLLDRQGKVISQVGTQGQQVPIDLLQSLYLSDSLRISPPSSRSSTPLRSPLSHHARTASAPPVAESVGSPPLANWPRSVSFTSKTTFPPVKRLPQRERKRILVTGGAGFVGSHLVDRLMCMGHDVVVLDNFFSGRKTSLSHWVGHPNFELVRADVVEPFMVEVDQIYHLACPASPKAYQLNAVKTLKTNFMGTMNMLGLAKRVKARFLLSSTSEIYGSPAENEHPQRETYWGNVNPVGPRACYDEGKRVAEALTYGYSRQDHVEVRVARIFNCYGPRMNSDDGRLVSNFIMAALRGEPLEIYGDGQFTRSLMFVHDLVTGLIALMNSDYDQPVNLGSEDEATIEQWATLIRDKVEDLRSEGEIPAVPRRRSLEPEQDSLAQSTSSTMNGDLSVDSVIEHPEGALLTPPLPKKSEIKFVDAVVDDPPRRKPDISRAKEVLGWQPSWTIEGGIEESIRYFAAIDA